MIAAPAVFTSVNAAEPETATPVTATVANAVALTVPPAGGVADSVALFASENVVMVLATLTVNVTVPLVFAAMEPSVHVTVPAAFEHRLPPLQPT